MKIVSVVLFAVFLLVAVGSNLCVAGEDELPAESSAEESSIPVCSVNVIQADSEPLGEQATGFFSSILDTHSWPARWQCGIWTPLHGWLYIISDGVIWLSYFMIPVILAFFAYKKKSEPFAFRYVVFLFIAFILACGLTHLLDAIIFWWPAYKLSALVRFGTAVVSMSTVFVLVRVTPKVLEYKSPEALELTVQERSIDLIALNARLLEEVSYRKEAEEKLLTLNKRLEENARGLEQMNEELRAREAELRRSEETVRELNMALEDKVARRTEELDNSNRELEAFTYSVSHDLRAPLRSIHGYTNILREDYGVKLDDTGKKALDVVIRNSKYMSQLIDDLLDFSRTSRLNISREYFDTTAHVNEIISEMIPASKRSSMTITIHPLEPCYADVNLMRQVWINLISNAVKYTSYKEHPRIEIGCQTKEGEITYFIKDNGVGFDMAYSDKLFGVFQRLHKKEQFEGTGVGLALVKRIIERHGGKINANATVNEGATFYFKINESGNQ